MRYFFIAISAVLTFASSTAIADTWALRGTLLGPDGIGPGTVVITDQKISAAGKDVVPPAGVSVVEVTGLIMPGFIDLHNHLTWNVFPRWRPGRDFHNRYEWQETAEYDRLLRTPQGRLIEHNLGCDANLYAEVKVLAGGATSVAGSYRKPDLYDNGCIGGLVRNLDANSGFGRPASNAACTAIAPPEYSKGLVDVIAYEVFPLELSRKRGAYYLCELESGNLRSLVIHLAEGSPSDASAHREFRMLSAQGFLRDGVSIIHGTALWADDFTKMADAKVGLIWSPRSNDELYGGTSNIPAAQKAGVSIAIAPDWSPTGSAGMLQEITYAAARYPIYFNARQLLEMATFVPARLSRLDDRLGRLQPNYFADLTVIGMRGGSPESVVKASPADVQLVVVGGQPVYGDQDLLRSLSANQKIDSLTVCGTAKGVVLGTAAGSSGRSWADITKGLQAELDRSGLALAPFDCD